MENDARVASRHATVRDKTGVPVGRSTVLVADESETPLSSAGAGDRPVHQVSFEAVVAGRGKGPAAHTDRVSFYGQYPAVPDIARVHGGIVKIARKDSKLARLTTSSWS